jgi:hypothetical protein
MLSSPITTKLLAMEPAQTNAAGVAPAAADSGIGRPASREPERSRDVILLIHLLEHLGVPSGVAIAIVIAGRKALKAGGTRMGARRDHAQRSVRGRR